MTHNQIELSKKVAEALGVGHVSIVLKDVSTRNMVADATIKYLIVDAADKPLAFVLSSNEEFPDAVSLATEAAFKAQAIVGSDLADAVAVPLASGYAGEKSFAVYRLYTPLLRTRNMKWLCTRQLVSPQIFWWLKEVAKKTTQKINDDRLGDLVIAPLTWMMNCSSLPTDIQNDARVALEAAEKGKWNPRCVFSHNDLWLDNIMIGSRFGRGLAAYGLGSPRIIDWLSSTADGIPAFDAIKYANSAGFSLRRIRSVISQINGETGVNEMDGFFDLVAGLGRLGMNRGEFPLSKYAEVAGEMINTYRSLLTPVGLK